MASLGGPAHGLPDAVKVYEMAPRDGLQNEPKLVPTETKIELIERLGNAGLKFIETTSFVSKAWVPQMGDADAVMRGIRRRDDVMYAALTPNAKGFEAALAAGTKEVAVFAAATDAFSRRNINCNVLESLERFGPVVRAAKANGVRVRGYVSCALGCPYQGPVAPDAVGFVAQSLAELGCYEISLGDTIGVGTPASTRALLASVRRHLPLSMVAVHFHDTYGQAVANCYAALCEGVATLDASVGGLGGCPYARGASGNAATEDVVYMLHGLGIHTGIDLDALADAGEWACAQVGRDNGSKVGRARMAQRRALADAEAAAAAAAGDPKAAEKAADKIATARTGLCWPAPPDLLGLLAG